MSLAKVIPNLLDADMTGKIISGFVRRELRGKSFQQEDAATVFYPYHLFLFNGRIKRGFNLPSRQVPMVYIIDGLAGQLFKLQHFPELEWQDLAPASLLPGKINGEEAENKGKEFVCGYLRRSFRSFWAPLVEVEKKELAYIPFFLRTLVVNGNRYPTCINSFTGEMSFMEEGLFC